MENQAARDGRGCPGPLSATAEGRRFGCRGPWMTVTGLSVREGEIGMKRIMALALALVLLTIGVQMAAAEEWSSSKPYGGVPEIDLTQKLGYMVFYPNESMAPEGLCDRLYIYLPRDDVQAGDGLLLLYTAAGEVWRTRMNDESCVTLRPLTAGEMDSLMWKAGVCFEIALPRSLTIGESYTVNLEKGCIVAGEVTNVQIGGKDAWTFEVKGDYGMNAIEYRRLQPNGKYEEMITAPQAGDEIRFDLVLGGQVVAASLYSNGTVSFQPNYLTESGEVTGIVTGESPSWGVIFLDANGNVVSQADF